MGLTFQRVLAPLGLGVLGEGVFLSVSFLWIVSVLGSLHFLLQTDFHALTPAVPPGRRPLWTASLGLPHSLVARCTWPTEDPRRTVEAGGKEGYLFLWFLPVECHGLAASIC